MTDKGRYTAEDFIRYHKNEMSEAEKHALERAALEDSFLAEALEGYAVQPAETDFLTVRKQAEINRENVVPITREKDKRFAFGKVAALLICIIGLSLVFYLVNKKEEPVSIADNKIELVKSKAVTESPQSISPATAEADQPNANIKLPQRKSDKPVNELRPEPSAVASAPPVQLEPGVSDDAIAKANEALISPAERKAQGMISTREDDVKKDASKSFLAEESNSKPNTELQTVTVGALGMRQNPRAADGRPVNTDNALSGKVSGITIKQAEESAFKRLQYYLNTEAKKLKAFDPFLQGNIRLIFDTDEKGGAINVIIDYEKCEGCSEDAIELLKAAPMKLAPNLKAQKVEIDF